jgi:hypothetical protein
MFNFDANLDPYSVPPFDIDADPAPPFHSDADADPDPASQNDADPCSSVSSTLLYIASHNFKNVSDSLVSV